VLALMLTRGPMALEPSDAELARLIAAAGASAQQAEGALFERYAGRVRLYGRKHLRSDAAADDLVQQVMLRLLEAVRAGRVDDPSKLSSFIFGTCRNVSWDLQRSDQRQRRLEREHELLVTESSMPEHSERDVVQLIRCLAELPERESRVLRMSFMEDRPAEDIAERLGLSTGNVRVIRCRALAKLAVRMDPEEKP
jgi:RNA polymerase sigma-70 factor, ECF subfamily